jgi:hypothetical protein
MSIVKADSRSDTLFTSFSMTQHDRFYDPFFDDSPDHVRKRLREPDSKDVIAAAPLSSMATTFTNEGDSMLLATPPTAIMRRSGSKSSPSMNFDEDIFDRDPVPSPLPVDVQLIGGWAQLVQISTEPPTPQIQQEEQQAEAPKPPVVPALGLNLVYDHSDEENSLSAYSSQSGSPSNSASNSPRVSNTEIAEHLTYLFGQNALILMNEGDMCEGVSKLLLFILEKTGLQANGETFNTTLAHVQQAWKEKRSHLHSFAQNSNVLNDIEQTIRNDIVSIIASTLLDLENELAHRLSSVDITEKNVEIVWMNHKSKEKSPRVSSNKNPRMTTEARAYLLDWFNEHISYPYPTEKEKLEFEESTGLTKKQIKDWFVNARQRYTPKDGRKKVTPKGYRKNLSPRSPSPTTD